MSLIRSKSDPVGSLLYVSSGAVTRRTLKDGFGNHTGKKREERTINKIGLTTSKVNKRLKDLAKTKR